MPTIKLQKKKDIRVPTVAKRDFQSVYQDKRWYLIRDEKRRVNPICEHCERVPLKEVHHKTPFQWGRNKEEIELLAFDFDNTASLCEICHEREHLRLKEYEVFLKRKLYQK